MRDEPNPRQQALDGLTGERFGESPTQQPISEPVNVGKGPSTMLVAQALENNRRRRARVLAHPDIAKRLTELPLSYAQPEQWSGYIPPATQLDRDGIEAPYDSPRRDALNAILLAVNQRELAAAAEQAGDKAVDSSPTQRAIPDPL